MMLYASYINDEDVLYDEWYYNASCIKTNVFDVWDLMIHLGMKNDIFVISSFYNSYRVFTCL